jgi:hypothetical protein
MNMNFTSCIPSKPHLAKFVFWLENLESGQALNLSYGGIVAHTLRLFLTNKSAMLREDGAGAWSIREYKAVIPFQVTARMESFNSFYISRKSIVLFNQHLHVLFYEILLTRILNAKSKYGLNEKDVIYEFMKELDIEEDLTYDAADKAIDRLRVEKNLPRYNQQPRRRGLVA